MTQPPGAQVPSGRPAAGGARPAPARGAWCLQAIAPVFTAAHLRRTISIAAVVGTLLTLVNQGDVILGGGFSQGVAVKMAINYACPFVVSNLGLLSRGAAPSAPSPPE